MNTMQLYAQASPTSGEAAPQVTPQASTEAPNGKAAKPDAPGGAFGPLMFPILLIAVFYFLLIRPQQKKEKERQKKLKELQKGDKVVTRGGIIGVVVGLKLEEGVAKIKIADDVKVDVSISAIEMVNPDKDEKKTEKK